MEFRILGTVEVRSRGRVLKLVGRQRKIVAILLLDANHVIPIQLLIDAIWDDRPPSSARRQVQNCVSSLRKEWATDGAPDTLIAGDSIGYRIQTMSGEIDAEVFEHGLADADRLLALNRTGEAAVRLREALDLWRGPALPELDGRAFEAAAARLNELRLTTIEQYTDLELRLGRPHQLVGPLTELVLEYPLRERLVGQLMLALHWSGRQAEALRVYYDLRARLADELGLVPSRRLAHLHDAVLIDNPALSGKTLEVVESLTPTWHPLTRGRPQWRSRGKTVHCRQSGKCGMPESSKPRPHETVPERLEHPFHTARKSDGREYSNDEIATTIRRDQA